jgi:UDP-N-acetylglucosamine diphosphorylase/glucosamine-1-phosphate N-acetyltransferase
MQLILFDPPGRTGLYPFTEVRSIADLRVGLLTQHERWARLLQRPVQVLTTNLLQRKYWLQPGHDNLYLHAGLIPATQLIRQLQALAPNTALLHGNGTVLAYRGAATAQPWAPSAATNIVYADEVRVLQHAHELVQWNAIALQADFGLLTQNRTTEPLSATNNIIGQHPVFLEQGAVAEHCVFNTTEGPVYLGRNSLVMEGSTIRGPFGLLEGGVVKMGARIYAGCTLGRYSVAGGEIKNTILFDYANKAHDGYLGDAVIGSWCNLGAGTSCSNIKNNAGMVRTWNPYSKKWIAVGQKCGAFLGDYSRTAIHTALNTGTVAGVGCNIMGNGFLPKYIPDFTWNCATGERYVAEKLLRDIENWMQLKNHQLSEADKEILLHLHRKQSEEA